MIYSNLIIGICILWPIVFSSFGHATLIENTPGMISCLLCNKARSAEKPRQEMAGESGEM
jgi:hypothetical protein